ncbi:MAG TPA: prepilin-type N-terminal cleavage/methylation domain-containing protein [Nitriliruptorales bacterium]|nr:prepilin-type N-terminal cleavage/methylation domain-containing protein [Nitriliruptorales bacterium]
MSRLARDESGFTLIELLLAAVLMLVILGATLTTLESFQSNADVNNRQNDSQEEARRTTELLVRELRNLASPTDEDPWAIKRAEAQDLIVQSVADVKPAGSLNKRNTQYVRYCYDAASSQVIRQRFTWTTATDPDYPTATACTMTPTPPPSTEASAEVVAQNVVNGTRPLFTYNDVDVLKISEIHASLYVDVNPGTRPAETSLSTTVFLRNQNRAPIARFSAVPSGASIVLNGSDSEDPEERALTYEWYEGEPPTGVKIGDGIVWVQPAAPGQHNVYLIVKDQADLSNTAPPQPVCIPGGIPSC